MKRMKSVSTLPYFVETVEPSMMGSRSRCTPSLLASAPYRVSLLLTILSISSMNTMPSDSTELIASFASDSVLMRRSISASSISGRASLIVIFFFPPSFFPNFVKMKPSSWPPIVPSDGMLILGFCGWSISMVRASRSPFRRHPLNCSRVVSSFVSPMRRSRIFSSTAPLTCAAILRFILARAWTMALSTRSRMIWSTSRPWNPTSVNLVASTLTNGASASFARRRAISVLPQPVGPIMRMFFGTTSDLSFSGSRCRRQRFLIATATARLASCCPTMCLSSSRTTADGVKASMVGSNSSTSTSTVMVGLASWALV
mmetsp:Transcript_16906/g.47188  ORF Transcript_16906/g.47188 Transcript_16906/m.47188 type:complete len:315 (-) Transcript_16906:361-1305(-)